MTRKITANLYMTLDGRGEFPSYPGSDRETGEINPMMREFWANRYDDVTTVVMGRRSFVGHQRVHSVKGRKPTDPPYMFEYSRYLDRVEKICLSHRLKKTDWENSRIMSGDLAQVLGKLKREKGGNIMVEGGPALVKEVVERQLADDYWMLFQPVVYGRGPRYWTNMPAQTTLKLLETVEMQDGELLLHYEAVRGKWPKS